MKFRRRTTTVSPAHIEPMESRTMLSATLSSNLIHSSAASSSANIQGYTPAQIGQTYGFDQIKLSDGSTADGSGQTIAIVDAYNDPKVSADLNVFDTEFNLPDANLKVVNQNGGANLPKNNANWDGEIAMDVEWAHAIAPGASILLVEAKSDNTDDLLAGVNYARSANDVSTVSMSWGGSEFGSFSGGGETSSQTAYDADFTTPVGHTGVTFVASAGDEGQQGGAEWPATSPNVIGVGGTTLYGGDTIYPSEVSWSDSSGGYSTVESEPSYQNAVQNHGYRSSPDVSYDADPNTGFAVFDSVTDQGTVGWQESGGTSAGAPQWAALVAIADQIRNIGGSGTLGGASQTLPTLYSLYAAPYTSAYSSYTQYFNDVSSGGSPIRHGITASLGYDTVTGLGSPNAPGIVDALAGIAYGGRPNTPHINLPVNPFSASIIGSTPTSGIIGSKGGHLVLKISNVSGQASEGSVTVTLSLSSDGTYSSHDPVVITQSFANFKLGRHGTKNIRLKLSYDSSLTAGTYIPIAEVSAINTASAPAEAVASTGIDLEAPSVDLSPVFKTDPVAIADGKPTIIAIRIENDGNSKAIGTIGLSLDAITHGSLTSTSVSLASIVNRKVHIKPGKSIMLHIKLAAPASAPGSYALEASLSSSTTIPDSVSGNDTAIATTTLA